MKKLFRVTSRKANEVPYLVNYTICLLSRIYTGDFFACDFLIKMDVAKLHLFNNGSHCDKSYLTAENHSLKLFPFR